MNNPRCLQSFVASAILAFSASAIAQEEATETEWLRAVETAGASEQTTDTESLRLEIAVRRYVAPEARGGEVALVGVAHIGDATYYAALAELLAEYDLVLYETVAPSGANGVGGADDAERALQTQQAMRFVGSVLARHLAGNATPPEDIAALAQASSELDSRFPAWIEAASRDGWDRPLRMELLPAEPALEGAQTPGVRWQLISYGADGIPAGDGVAADIVLSNEDVPRRPPSRGMQAEIASALGLAFQLEAMDYGGEGWILADMTAADLEAAARERQIDVAPLMEGLSGSSLPARLGRTILLVLRFADLFSGNQARDLVKVVLVEMLADPGMLERAQRGTGGLGDMGPLMELILLERNDVALAKLDEVLERASEDRVALFYGAAHMEGLADGLRERGYAEAGDAIWLPAIEVDLAGSNVDPQTLELVRRRIHASLGGASRQRTPLEHGEEP